MSSDKNDPRDASLETEFTTPKTWFRDTSGASCYTVEYPISNLPCLCGISDGLGASGMFLSGLIMVTRNRYVRRRFYIKIEIWKEEGANARRT